MKQGLLLNLTLSILLIFPCAALSGERSVIVGFHEIPGPSEKALIKGAKGVIKRSYRLINAMAVSIPEKAIEKLKKDKKVAYVENNGIFRASGEVLPGEEYLNAWGVWHIGADAAHASANKGAGVKVAVIDTGIDYTHEDLDDNYAGGYDFVFEDYDPFDDNIYSHGSHVAGIIAAEENGIGVIGVAPEAELYALKVLDGAGFGLLDWVIAAIEWSVENGMEIANLSLEGPDFQSLQDACDSAASAGVLLIAAGGNTNGGSVKYPAGYDSVIAVTGTDIDDVKAGFSPVGPEIELSAPGLEILSTVVGGYGFLSGTSQAAPHVAGTAALFILSNTEDLNDDEVLDNEDIRLKLRMSAVDIGEAGVDSIYGFGLVNAAAASITVCEDCLADCNNDGSVTILDLLIMKTQYGLSDCADCAADLNGDGDVDIFDLIIMKTEYSKRDCCL